MTIIEQSIIGKQSQETCEDGIVTTDDFIAVIDGSTSKSPVQLSTTMRNGRFAMLVVSETIKHMPADTTCEEFCARATLAIRNEYENANADLQLLHQSPTWRMAASTAIYSREKHEIWMIGDCQCFIGNAFYDNPKPSEQWLAEKRSIFIQNALANGSTISQFMHEDTGRKHILSDLIKSCQRQNIDYSVIDGFPIPMKHVRIIPIPQEKKMPIVLATDGYPYLAETLQESESLLAKHLTDDPLNIGQFKATKGLLKGNRSFDDRAYIRFFE